MKKISIGLSVVLILLVASGCVAPSPVSDTSNPKFFSRNINASQDYYDNLVLTDPSNSTAWVIRAMYYNDNFNQYDKALENFDTAIELQPDNAYGWLGRCTALRNLNETIEAQSSCNKAVSLNPELSRFV